MAFKKFAILASGNGTNANQLIKHWQRTEKKCSIEVVITDNPEAPVIKKAQELGIKCQVVAFKRSEFASFAMAKSDFETRLLSVLKEHQIDWLLLAGFMRVLSKSFLEKFYDHQLGLNKVVNIHPSLLPSFKGRDGIKDAFEFGVKVSGITIHFVDSEVDNGPVILQKSFMRSDNDTLEIFRARGQQIEYELYPLAFDLIARDDFEVKINGDRKYVFSKES